MTVPSITVTALSTGGSGIPFLLGPSLGTRVAAVWGPVLPLLAADHPVFAWDLPGHGTSPATTTPFSIDEVAAAVSVGADDAGLSHYAAAGVSLGGLVSLAVALRSPAVSAVTLVCALPKIGTAEAWAERARQVRASGTPSLVSGSSQRWFAPGFIEQEPMLTGGLLKDLMDVDDESYALCVDALAAADYRERVSQLTVPFTVIAGEVDAVIPLADADAAVSSARRGRLEVLPHTSHLASVERPAEVAAILLSEVS